MGMNHREFKGLATTCPRSSLGGASRAKEPLPTSAFVGWRTASAAAAAVRRVKVRAQHRSEALLTRLECAARFADLSDCFRLWSNLASAGARVARPGWGAPLEDAAPTTAAAAARQPLQQQ